jgi:hypothetical protein
VNTGTVFSTQLTCEHCGWWARPTYDSRDSAPPFALAHLFDMSWRRPGWEKIDVHQ